MLCTHGWGIFRGMGQSAGTIPAARTDAPPGSQEIHEVDIAGHGAQQPVCWGRSAGKNCCVTAATGGRSWFGGGSLSQKVGKLLRLGGVCRHHRDRTIVAQQTTQNEEQGPQFFGCCHSEFAGDLPVAWGNSIPNAAFARASRFDCAAVAYGSRGSASRCFAGRICIPDAVGKLPCGKRRYAVYRTVYRPPVYGFPVRTSVD